MLIYIRFTIGLICQLQPFTVRISLVSIRILVAMKRRENLVMGGLIAVCLILTALNVLPRLTLQASPVKQTQPDITISITGEVNRPGTYTLPWGAKVEDAIQLAEGFTEVAAADLVNLAAPLDAGEQIFVPAITTETGSERVSVNSASATELDTLPGVGPTTAQRIIEGRPYNTIEDLLGVKGIGEKTLEKLRPFITL